MSTDIEILRQAYDREHDTRSRLPVIARSWESYTVGANRSDINRLLNEGLIRVAVSGMQHGSRLVKYKLTEKGTGLVAVATMENEQNKIPAADLMDAMSLVIGFEDIKQAIAMAVSTERRTNFLLEGPPACAKSVMLEGVRSAVPSSYIVFGSRTSASGLSDVLFEHQPKILLLDEADKMHMDVFSVLLGLMEKGEILETKSGKTRGITLKTMVIAACNGSAKMPREFLSRFALHVHFPQYTRQEFIDVCVGFLTRAEGAPENVALMIGEAIFDNNIGDVRKARGAWQLMTEPTVEEVNRVINLMVKYSPETPDKRRHKAIPVNRLC